MALGLIFALPLTVDALAEDKRSKMTPAQKKELRKRAREYCLKHYVKGAGYLERVEILSSGQVRCWIRG